MRHSLIPPCAAWAEPLAKGHPDDLTPAERAALDAHVATCAACAAARADYAAMDAHIRALPAVLSLAELPDELRPMEDAPQMRQPAGQVIPFPGRGAPPVWARQRARLGGLGRAVALVAVLAVVLGGYAVLLHRPGGGLANLPTYSTARVGIFQQVKLPMPYAEITAQGSVPGLLYACAYPGAQPGEGIAASTKAVLWRSEDGGATWHELPPSPVRAQHEMAGCIFMVSAVDPDSVLLAATDELLLYSADRGEHWRVMRYPDAGARTRELSSPTAIAGGIWVIQDGQSQPPVIWVSHDHGAHWAEYGYPVPVSHTTPCCYALGTPLDVGVSAYGGYSRGGLVWPYQHTLWWTPDYGAHWQQLGAWTPPPGDDSTYTFGTADLSVLYAISEGKENTQLLWRSTDRSQSWQRVTAGPAIVSPGHGLPDVGHRYPQDYRILHDGTLLAMAPIAAQPNQIAFYTLAPGGTKWRQASGALPSGICQITSLDPSQGLSPCVSLFSIRVVEGGKGAAVIYLSAEHQPNDGTPTWVAPITWG